MGLVMNLAKQMAWIKDYPDESIPTPDVLINISDPNAIYKMNAVSAAEVLAMCLKLDLMSEFSPAVALLVAEGTGAIIQMVRMVKWQTKQNFRGFLSAGQALTLDWLRPIYIGSPLLNNNQAAVPNGGPYAAANPVFAGIPPRGTAGTRTWLHTGVAGTLYNLIPAQQQNLYSGIVHLGVIDPIDTPKLGTITWYKDNTLITPLAVGEDIRKSWGTWDIPIVRWEKPILVPPLSLQACNVVPDLAGDDNVKLLSILVLQAQDVVQ